ncbi:MAG: nucleoside hydrolase [Sedimentisphaeraceae bacterium JB056]
MCSPKIPIIVDTDIGGDIDDAWALAFLLNSPEFDIKLIVTAVGDTLSRAKIVAKMLEAAGRTDIPIAIGLPEVNMNCYCDSWAADYNLADYPGIIYQSSEVAKAIVDTVNASDEEITVLALAPVTNLAAALDLDASITSKSRFVGMLGSVYKGYDGASDVSKECNIVNNITAAKKVFTSDWDMTITPLDTCGLVKLRGDNYKVVRDNDTPLIKALIENYDVWLKRPGYPTHPYAPLSDIDFISSTLFDTVAVYLAMSEEFLDMETLPIEISDDGFTIVKEGGKMVRCAVGWKDMPLFEDFLTQRLVNSKQIEEDAVNYNSTVAVKL